MDNKLDNLKNLKYEELKELAKQLKIKLSYPLKREKLIELIKNANGSNGETKPCIPYPLQKRDEFKNLSKEEEEKKLKNIMLKTANEKSEYIEIPEELKDFKLTRKKKKLRREDIEYNDLKKHKYNFEQFVPQNILEEVKRDGYSLIFPLGVPEDIQRQMNRGADFVKDKEGKLVKISAGQPNAKGELQYHIVMKIANMILEEENRIHIDKHKKKIRKLQKSSLSDLDKSIQNDDYMRSFVERDNQLDGGKYKS
jgi:hypothetical protein